MGDVKEKNMSLFKTSTYEIMKYEIKSYLKDIINRLKKLDTSKIQIRSDN